MRPQRHREGRSNPLRRFFEVWFPKAFAWVAVTVYRLAGDRRSWLPVVVRVSAHLAVIAVAIAALSLSHVEWPAQALSALSSPSTASFPAMPAAAEYGASRSATGGPALPQVVNIANRRGTGHSSPFLANAAVFRVAQPHTTIPERPRLGVVTYTVQAGDTVQSIADAYGLQPTSIMWANPTVEDAPDLLRIGQQVVILPVDGVYHKVEEGETLEEIAETYKVDVEAITACEYNHLEPPDYPIQPGMWLIVPGGEKPYVPKVITSYTGSVPEGARGTGRFQWPVLGYITQGYWYGHRAIDIGAPTGSAVVAADGGFISFAGWTDVGYGYLIVVDHANGFVTYYAHLSNIYVFPGQAVERGQVIGAVGSTGHSTGPHLHFEVRYYGVQQNPRAYLP